MYLLYISICRGGFSSFVYMVSNSYCIKSEKLYVHVNTDFVHYFYNQPVGYLDVIFLLCLYFDQDSTISLLVRINFISNIYNYV